MSSAAAVQTDKPPRPRRRFPVALRMFAAIMALTFAASALWIGIPGYRQWRAIRDIERAHGNIETEPVGPQWLLGWIGDQCMRPWDRVVKVYLINREEIAQVN